MYNINKDINHPGPLHPVQTSNWATQLLLITKQKCANLWNVKCKIWYMYENKMFFKMSVHQKINFVWSVKRAAYCFHYVKEDLR